MDTTAAPRAQNKVPPTPRAGLRIAMRVVGLLVVMFIVGALMHRLAESLERGGRPAGFFRGMLQGALMPAALPTLLVGRDVIIYAQNNAGIPYKLGYTLGVNLCGAVFFGIFFARVRRWRKRMNGNSGP